MSVLKYKDPSTGAWVKVPKLNVVQIYNGGGSITGIPSDIVKEADRVVSSIQSKIVANSVNFIAISDMHELGDHDLDGSKNLTDAQRADIKERYRRANRNAGQGARLIAEKIKTDFFANLGDFAWGLKDYTMQDMMQSITNARGYTAGIEPLTECFFTAGNHDVGYKTGNIDENIVAGMIGKYRYVDLTAKKVRVICLNTADVTDGTDGDERISGEQMQWFADALDLSGKSDAAKWGIIVLSHHPLDWGNIKPAANCVAAYMNGTAYSATHDGMTITKDFTGKNMAAFIANFHGHTHCFKVANISGTEAMRVAIPNACYARENEYGKAGNAEFGETESYAKSDNTGKNTAFCVVSVDLDKKVIYADCFGAGYDRVISYGGEVIVTYSVTNSLSVATNSNGASVVTEGSTYSATISVPDGYELDAIAVTMGGIDITASAVSGNAINISEVTGNIVITAFTIMVEDFEYGVFTNRVLTSEERDSTNVYNTIGYKNDTYPSETNDGVANGIVCTGWIPYAWSVDNPLYVKGATLDISNSSVRMMGFSTKDYVNRNVGYTYTAERWEARITIEQLGDKYYKLTPKKSVSDVGYIRLSLIGTGDNLIVTINEPIHAESGETGSFAVTSNLTNVTTSNSATSVDSGSSYNTTLTAMSGYKISAVMVTMGGADITSSAYSNGTIRIGNVTGIIGITAVAVVDSVADYTNQVLTSIDTDGTIYNGTGYQEGYRFKSDASTAAQAGAINSGYIAYNDEVIRAYGTTNGTVGYSGNYLVLYDSNFNKITQYSFSSMAAYGATWTVLNGKYMLTVEPDAITLSAIKENLLAAAYIRCGFAVCTSENFIVTLDEEIT